MKRKLTSFTTPSNWETEPKYRISYAYYEHDQYDNDQWTGVSEDAALSEDELYALLKPALQLQIVKGVK